MKKYWGRGCKIHRKVVIPLHMAVKAFEINLVQMLLEAKTPVDQVDEEGQSAVHLCCQTLENPDSLEILKKLISYKASVNLPDINGLTPLHISFAKKWWDRTMILLENGALSTIKDKSGECPLHMAACDDNKIMRLMVDSYLTELQERNVELTIEAYEITALAKSCNEPFECMLKATQLRMVHNIPKRTLPPMACYGFLKEWETITELEIFRDDKKQQKMQAILARERIHEDSEKLRDLVQEELIAGESISACLKTCIVVDTSARNTERLTLFNAPVKMVDKPPC